MRSGGCDIKETPLRLWLSASAYLLGVSIPGKTLACPSPADDRRGDGRRNRRGTAICGLAYAPADQALLSNGFIHDLPRSATERRHRQGT
jgi:hypothetical protein